MELKKILLLLAVVIIIGLLASVVIPNRQSGYTETPGDSIVDELETPQTQTQTNPIDSVIDDVNEISFEEAIKDWNDTVQVSYEHVMPGVYSEIYVTFKSTPGAEASVVMEFDNKDINTKTAVADENGIARVVFRVTQFGEYTVKGRDGMFMSAKSITVK